MPGCGMVEFSYLMKVKGENTKAGPDHLEGVQSWSLVRHLKNVGENRFAVVKT